jgi:hypothetical protein
MEEHKKLVTTMCDGNISGYVWRVSYFDSDGAEIGTGYEVELASRAIGTESFRLDQSDLKSCLSVLTQARLFILDLREEEVGFSVSIS